MEKESLIFWKNLKTETQSVKKSIINWCQLVQNRRQFMDQLKWIKPFKRIATVQKDSFSDWHTYIKTSQTVSFYFVWQNTKWIHCKDSFTFVHEISTQDSDICIASLDGDTLFTNIPLDMNSLMFALRNFFKHHKLWFKEYL